ncbi:uncharacterized protein LOC132175936 [Corylus avellana]|uniref:uncharacterized protein LOC132175936 n=1 Tax=Corylus avellana TaxID=13451 RepID=UPI00286C535F|nr:uncharacterized protein LOC132175936 [Corylus avellana]
MAEISDTIIEEREELMISPTGDSDPIKRKAHFLNPSVNPAQGPEFGLPFLPIPPKSTIPEIEKLPLIVKYRGRRFPQNNWKEWVDSLHSKHQSTWKKAGIYEAILSSTCQILRHNELIVNVAERWRPETNTFLFPWAEATITLEDMMILGGYSVLGDSISKPLETNDLWEMKSSLTEAHKQLPVASHAAWMNYFMGTDQDLEHEAFLVLWLSRCVTNEDKGDRLVLDLWAPFELVQLWIWERFPALRPTPNLIKDGEPRVARWHKVKKLNIGKVRFVIDSEEGDGFQWRPYAAGLENWLPPKLYRDEEEEWVSIGPDLDEEVASFARCLRVSELVGQKCIEQYLPHRVAMQFGMDQDIPGFVPRFNMNVEAAWSYYCRPITDKQLYLPARLFESDVTERYLKWWKQSMVVQEDAIKHFARRPRNRRRFGRIYGGNVEDSHVSVPHGFPPEKKTIKEAEHTTLFGALSATNNLENKLATDVMAFSGSNSQSTSHSMADDGGRLPRIYAGKVDYHVSVPPGFPPKCHKVDEKKIIKEEAEPTPFGALSAPNNLENKLAADKPFSGSNSQSMSHSMADDGGRLPGIYAGKVEDYHVSVPPGFPPTYRKVDEKKTIEEEAEHAPFGALSAPNNLENKLATDVMPFSGSSSQIRSHSMSGDGERLPRIYGGKVDDSHVSVPPGFPPKCQKVDEMKTIKEEAEHAPFGALSAPNNLENKLATDVKHFSSSNSQIRSHSMSGDGERLPRIYGGKVDDSHVSVPPGFPPKCQKVDEMKTIKEEAEHAPFGALSAPNNLENKLAADVKPFSGSNSQNISHSMADDGAAKKDLLMRPMPEILQTRVSMPDLADATVIEMGCPSNAVVHVKDNDGESSSYCKPEIPGLELEVRVSRLERVFAELKAARYGRKVVNKPTKEDPYQH